ncbi:hypothetical protein OAT42_02390 [Alphaproteobacteria bacterium]|nr:hypothetical protein [Alphaproteobacteria bacterium]
MFYKFLILIFLLANTYLVHAETNTNTNSSIKSLTESFTNTLTKTFNKTEIKNNVNLQNKTNKPIIKNKNSSIILNKFFSSYNVVGEVNYTHLFWDLYDAKLLTETGDFDENKFALVLKYNTKISKKSVVKETLIQLKKQKKYTKEELDELTTLLSNTFKDIKVGDTFIGIKENNTAYFYFKDEKVLETKDLEFINLFFDIWLREDSQNPAFTKKLLGQK